MQSQKEIKSKIITHEQMKADVNQQKVVATAINSHPAHKVDRTVFMKSPGDKAILRGMKKQIFSNLHTEFGTKRVGNKQFAIISKASSV